MNTTQIRNIIQAKPQIPFLSKINLWDFIDDVAVGVDLQISGGFELLGHPDNSLKDESEIESYLGAIARLLNHVPERTTVQFIVQGRKGDREILSEYSKSIKKSPGENKLAEVIFMEKEKFFKSKDIQKRRFFLFMTTYPNHQKEIPRLKWIPFGQKNFQAVTKQNHEGRIKDMESILESVRESLVSLGIKPIRCRTNDLRKYYFSHLNPKTAQFFDPETSKNFSERSMLVRNASENEYGHLLIDQIYHQGINLTGLPEVISPHDINAFINALPPDYDFNICVHIVNSEKLIDKLKTSANVSKSLSFSNFGSRYEAEQKYNECDDLIREVRGSSQKLFTFSMSVICKDSHRASVEAKSNQVMRAFRHLGSASAIVDHLNHEDLFLSVLPNHSHLNSRNWVIQTNPLTYLVPLSSSWKGTEKTKMIFENPEKELIKFDLFDDSLPAKNAVVVGTTGSGKSFSTNYLLTHFLVESGQNHVVIIDMGGSYRKLCRIFDGAYFDVELSDQFAFNPIPEPRLIYDGKQYDDDRIAYLTLIMEKMVLDAGEAMNSLGEGILEQAIKKAYEKYQFQKTPRLHDIYEKLFEFSDDLARHYAKNLEIWVNGRYSRIFNTDKTLDIQNKLIVFDLERLGQHPRLQSVYFYVIREIIDSKLRNKALKKIIVIDEGWRFFDDEVGSRLIESLYRTVRKNNGGVISISQSPIDFLNSKAANAIIANSYVKYILKLTKGYDVLPQFGLSSAEINAVKQLSSVPGKYSDVFIKFNEKGTILRIEPSSFDYWICTTNAVDYLREQEIRQAHPELTHIQVLQALAERYPCKENVE